MPYGSINDLPPSFKNLSTAQKQKAVQMLNAMLRDAGGDVTGEQIATVLKRVQTMNLAEIRPITLAEAPEGQKQISEPFEVLRAGEFSYRGETLKITEADLDKAIANFNAMQADGHDLVIDYDHSFAKGETSEAAGWFRELTRKGSSLFARVKWNSGAVQKIRDEVYRYFSPEFHEHWSDEHGKDWGFTLLAGGLTNRPFLKGMTPVALSEPLERELAQMRMAGVPEIEAELSELKASALSETRSEVADEKLTVEINGEQREFSAKDVADLVAKAGEEPTSLKVEVDGEAKTFTAEDVGKLVEEASKTDDGETRKLSDRVKTLSEELDAERKTLTSERFDRIFREAQKEGRVDAKEETRATWEQRVEKFGLEEVTKLLNELPTYIPVDERGSGADAGDAVPEQEGVDHDAARADREIKTLAEKEEITYSEAAVKWGERQGASA